MEICGYGMSYRASVVLKTARKEISCQWIKRTIEDPDVVEEISEREVRLWKRFPEAGERFLRVVVNPQDKIIITVFFDRGIRR